jgi:hypothetical protein
MLLPSEYDNENHVLWTTFKKVNKVYIFIILLAVDRRKKNYNYFNSETGPKNKITINFQRIRISQLA